MTFSASLSGLKAAEQQLGVTSDNIANSETTGFKKAIMEVASVVSGGIIGSGVAVLDVKSDFAQGDMQATDSNLDLAVQGLGFFITQDATGAKTYTRAGSFHVDSNGILSNGMGNSLVGYTADSNGHITGQQGILQVNYPILQPTATSAVTASLNLDPSQPPPTVPFVPGFSPNQIPDPNSYTSESQVEIFDSLGEKHVMTSYFVKAPVLNTWYVHIGVDGIDVTPTMPNPPSVIPPAVQASPTNPLSYTAGTQATPFTLVFDNQGKFILNNAGIPAKYYGNLPPTSGAVITAKGALPTVGDLDLTINGKPIEIPTTVDTFSYSDNSASAFNIASAINKTSALTLVTATANQTDFNLGTAPAGAPFTVAAGNMVINGIDMSLGANLGVFANATALVNYINTGNVGGVGSNPPIPNVAAKIVGGNFILYNNSVASNGMNITVETNGSGPAGGSFGAFAINAGAASQVYRGTITLTPGNKAVAPNTLNLGVPTYNGTGAVAANDIVINGIDISVGGPFLSNAALVNYINTGNTAGTGTVPPIPNMSAAINGAGELILTDAFGRDIVAYSSGAVSANNVTFAKFNTQAGAANTVTAKGSLSDEQPILIGGNAPTHAGFSTGMLYGVQQLNSDSVNVSFNPNSGALSLQNIAIDYSGSTQFQSTYSEIALKPNGNATGKLLPNGLSVDKLGRVIATYDNNKSQYLGQVLLARAPNLEGLDNVGNTSYIPTASSGEILVGAPGSSSFGVIYSKNLELSNVDLTRELVDLIQAQTAFGANAQGLRTQDAVQQQIINLR